MNTNAEKNSILSAILYLLFLFFFISFICSFRAITSICTGLIIITGLARDKKDNKIFSSGRITGLFLLGCLVLFLLQAVSLFYTHHQSETWAQLRLKSGLLFIPLAVICSGYTTGEIRKKLFPAYCLIVAGASLYCILMIVIRYHEPFDPGLLFYHSLVSPLGQHAVYFSIYVFIALVYLCESIRKNEFLVSQRFYIGLVLFFSLFLFLLSSKLIIAFYIVYLINYFFILIRTRDSKKRTLKGLFAAILIALIILLATPNPASDRFREVLKSNMDLVKQEKFDKGVYFNGLQFRLLQWRFVSKILQENHCWWLGTSPGDAQLLLDQEYISNNMYTGEPARGDHGFLGYNTHNQFLETFLQNGILGLITLLFISYTLIRLAWQRKERLSSFVIILILCWLFSESALETQYGILIFTFFPLFISPEIRQTF